MIYDTHYKAKKPDANGIVHYTDEENSVWHDLMQRQLQTVQGRACDAYLKGLEILNMPRDRIPQCHELDTALEKITGWSVAPVAALIPFEKFFNLLANKKFPAATFIRTREDFDYIKEPDIFHEFFGHCPMLTDPFYANFMQLYGQLGLKANEKDRVLLARLFWFTIEFGLVNTKKGIRIYGGGILSSHNETIYAVDSNVPERKPFNAMDALRTPYRIDIMQPIYYVLSNMQQLFELSRTDLMGMVTEARSLGEFPPAFKKDKDQPEHKDMDAC